MERRAPTASELRAVLRRSGRAAGGSALERHGEITAELAAALLGAGLDASAIARVVARRNDALTRRLLRRAEADLGAPPAPYAWIVFGSEGRMEQTLLTDQDDLLAYADEGEPSRAWFQALATRVNADLERAGFPPCRGGHMARNDLAAVSEWRRRFDGAVDGPRPHEAELWFDFRKVGGRLDTALLERPLRRAARSSLFLHLLAAEALEFQPPPPLLLRLRPARPVDLKKHGLIPIAFLARCHALEAGSPARGTLARLDDALRAGSLEERSHASLAEAFRFLLSLRLRVQLRARATGAPATDRVAPADLAPEDRARLREAFRAIRRWQDAAAQRFLVTR